MRYHCEDIMSIFFGVEGKLKLTAPFYSKLLIEQKKSKEIKSILQSDRQNAILVDLLMYTQISIDISYDPMQISCPQCSHMDWDCASMLKAFQNYFQQ